jgi:hypothetical protein
MNGMMTCATCRELLSPLLDRELGQEELRAAEGHLKACPDCCRELALLLCADLRAALVPLPEPPEGLWERIREVAGLPTASPAAPGAALPLQPEVLTPEETAQILRLSLDDLRASLDEIPHFHIGDHLRFRRRSLEAWIGGREQAPGDTDAPGDSRIAAGSNVVDFMTARARLTRAGRM